MRRFPMLPLVLCCTGSLVLSVVAPSFADKTVTTSTTQTTSSKATTSSDKAVVRYVGTKWVMPQGLITGKSPATRQQLEKFVRLRGYKLPKNPPKLPPASGKLPKISKQRGSVTPYRGGVYGQGAIFQYTNADVDPNSNTCGQAAAATMFTYWGTQPVDEDRDGTWLVKAINRQYPPDGWGVKDWRVSFGGNGTSLSRMGQILNNYGLDSSWEGGGWNTSQASHKTELQRWVGNRYPVIVVQDVGAAGWPVAGLHYTVVYAYDNTNVYLSNWYGGATSCTWGNFMRGWHTAAVTSMGAAGKCWLTWPRGKSNQAPPSRPPGA